MPVNILKWDPLAHLYAFLQPHLAAQFNQRLGRGLAKRRTLPVIIVPPTLSGAHHHECCWVSHQAPATLHLTTSCWPVIQAGQECWEASALRSNLQPVMDGMPPFPWPWVWQGGTNLWVFAYLLKKRPLFTSFPFTSDFHISLPMLSGITSQIYCLHSNSYLRVIFWGNQTGQWWIIAFRPGNEIIKYMMESVGDKRVERQ